MRPYASYKDMVFLHFVLYLFLRNQPATEKLAANSTGWHKREGNETSIQKEQNLPK